MYFQDQKYPLSMLITTIKVLNPISQDCSSFSMERDVLPSCPVSILRTRDIPRHPDRDAWILTGRFVPTHGMVPNPVSHEMTHQDLNPWL